MKDTRTDRISKRIARRLATGRELEAKELLSKLTPEERFQILLTITQ